MALINEAYEVLKDENIRKQYDREFKVSTNSAKTEPKTNREENFTSDHEASVDELLAPSILENALLQLEQEEKQFDYRLKNDISNIERKYSKHLKAIKEHIPGRIDVLDSSMKLEKSIIYGVAAFAGLWLVPIGMFLSLCGWGLFLVFSFLLIRIITLPVYRSDYVNEVKKAKAQRDIGIAKFKANVEAKVNYFKKMPIASVNHYFIRELSPRDRLLFVKVLKQREDTLQAEKAVQSTVKVVAAIGLLAVFLGGNQRLTPRKKIF